MTLTLLLDLDDTLLTTRIDAFIAAYLELLGNFLSQRIAVKGDAIIHHLMAATRKMIHNDLPDRTLEETFDQAFYPALGIPRPEIQQDIDRFYADYFPRLKTITTPRPEAIQLVDKAFKKGYQVVVATNPLFPRTAIVQRLDWAGLSPARYPFALITSYEDFHFTKHNPAYYAEILARLGCPAQPAWMVGNDPDLDIQPAAEAGISTYWINPGMPADEQQHHGCMPCGSLLDFCEWIDRGKLEEIQNPPPSPASVLAALQATPAAVHRLTRQIPLSAWGEQAGPGNWSLVEILSHLRDVEREVHFSRLETVLTEENPFLPSIDSDSWAADRGYSSEDPIRAAKGFIKARTTTISRLRTMPPASWDRPSRHAIFGPTRLVELMNFAASHDRLHLGQMKHLEQQLLLEGIEPANSAAVQLA
jgi:FMN phosphatase YigB (HAD superfamily)